MAKSWKQIAKAEFKMLDEDADRLKVVSSKLLAWEYLACNTRSLTEDEKNQEQSLVEEVKEICNRYGIKESDGNSIGYEFPDPRSGSGLRFVLPSGYKNSLGGYNL